MKIRKFLRNKRFSKLTLQIIRYNSSLIARTICKSFRQWFLQPTNITKKEKKGKNTKERHQKIEMVGWLELYQRGCKGQRQSTL